MTISRRDFVLAIPALGLSAAALPRRSGAAQLQEFNGPMAAANDVYRPVKLDAKPGATPSMTAAERDDLEHRIKCQCGCVLDVYTCRTTDFSCSVSPAMHSDVLALVEGGYSEKEILAAFQSVYGERVLMAPVKSGFNLLGYTMPFIALGTGAVVIAALLRRWRERARAAAAPESTPVATPVSATDAELAELAAAVKHDA